MFYALYPNIMDKKANKRKTSFYPEFVLPKTPAKRYQKSQKEQMKKHPNTTITDVFTTLKPERKTATEKLAVDFPFKCQRKKAIKTM